MKEPGKTPIHVDLRRHLREHDEDRDLTRLICEIADASKYIINAIRTGDLGMAGTSNLYGEEQLALDVLSDRIITKRLINSDVVANLVSEESGTILPVDPGNEDKYSVAFDPLDGSSLVDVNLAVGTIVSIYKGGISCGPVASRSQPCIFSTVRVRPWFIQPEAACTSSA